jgi:hypothetical protein
VFLRSRLLACVTAVGVLAPIGSAYAGTLTLTAQAGLGGVGRVSRWAPVRVSVDNSDRDFAGDIVVSWGDAVVRRALTLGSPARADIVLYIRSADVRDLVSVKLESHGVVVQSVDAAIRLQSGDADVTLCVGSTAAAGTRDDCAARISPAALPRSMRGYDAFDGIRWQGTTPDVLERDQQIAWEQWTAKRQLDNAGVISRPPRPVQSALSSGPTITTAAVGVLAYLGVLIVIAMAASRMRRRPLTVYGAIVVFAAAASAAALAAGRIGPSTSIVVTQSSRVEQLPSGGSVVAMMATVQYPTYDRFELRARSVDAAMWPQNGPRPELRFDEGGEPILAGVFGLASRQAFTLEGVVAFSPFQVRRVDGAVTVVNASAFAYHDCSVSDDLATHVLGALEPGRTLEVPRASASHGVVSCTLTATPVEFADPRYPVHVEGATDVVVHLE